MQIGSFDLSSGRTFIIAEACSNVIGHLHNLDRVVRLAQLVRADAVKVQLYRAEHFPVAEQVSKRRTEFPRERFAELVGLCREYGLYCGASVFDAEAVDCVMEAGGDFLKLATREWNNTDLFNKCRDANLPTIASYDARVSGRAFLHIQDNPIFMACWPEYPAESVRVPGDLSGEGWSSHTSHWKDCLIAVSRGAVVVEKHISFDKNDPEAGWSLNPSGFQNMVSDIRWVEGAR